MSTNINGRRSSLPIGQLYEVLVDSLKPQIKSTGKTLLNQSLAKMIAGRFDRVALGTIEAKEDWKTAQDIASDCYQDMADRQQEVKKTGRRDVDVDHEFEVFLFPSGDGTLIIPVCEQEELTSILDRHSSIERYSWWNSTDKPDDLSEEQWQQREKEWMTALPGSGLISERSLRMTLFDGDIRINHDVPLTWASIPSPEERLKRLGADEYVNRHYDQSKGMSQVFQLLESYKSDPELTQEVENELRPFILEIAKDTPVQRLRAQ